MCYRFSDHTTSVTHDCLHRCGARSQDRVIVVGVETLYNNVGNVRTLIIYSFLNGRQAFLNVLVEFSHGVDVAIRKLISQTQRIKELRTFFRNSLKRLNKLHRFISRFLSKIFCCFSSFTCSVLNSLWVIRITLPSVEEVKLLTTHFLSQTSLHNEIGQAIKDAVLSFLNCKSAFHITCLLGNVRNLTSQRSRKVCTSFFSIKVDIIIKIFLDSFHASIETFIVQHSSTLTKSSILFGKLIHHKLEPARISLWISKKFG